MELGPKRPSPLWFWGLNSIIVVYMDPPPSSKNKLWCQALTSQGHAGRGGRRLISVPETSKTYFSVGSLQVRYKSLDQDPANKSKLRMVAVRWCKERNLSLEFFSTRIGPSAWNLIKSKGLKHCNFFNPAPKPYPARTPNQWIIA